MRELLRRAHEVRRRVESNMKELLPDIEPAPAAHGERRRTAVLVVEDDERTRLAVAAWLTSRGLTVWAAANGREAAELLAYPPGRIGVALVDIGLPDMSGMSLCEMMREWHPFLPVLVFSGQATPEEVAGVLAAGALHYFSKPVDPDELASAIEDVAT
jgi:DNA-binding response OmpR family regulator